MTLSITVRSSAPEGGGKKVEGYMAFDASYASGGEPLTAAMLGLSLLQTMQIEEQAGYGFNYVPTNDLGGVVKAYRSAAVSGTIGNENSHTHAVALDSGASAAGSSHTHGLTLAASGAGDAHTHAATPGGTIDNESAHTHAVALDSGASGAGDAHTHGWTPGGNTDAGAAHTHAFTGTALGTDTFTVAHDATPETAALYVNTLDGVMGFLSCDNSGDSASDYFETAGGERVMVLDDSAGATIALAVKLQLYYDEDAASPDSRILVNNTITGKDLFVRTSGGKLIRIVHDAAAAATGVALYFNDDGADATLRLNGTLPSTANVTTNATDDSFAAFDIVPAGTNANESTHTHGVTAVTGTNANESTHTHGPGTLADAASGAGSAHSHGITGLTVSNANESTHTHALTGTTVDTESAHTHGPGTLADAASGAGSAHNHSLSGGAAAPEAEVTAGVDLAAAGCTKVFFSAFGR